MEGGQSGPFRLYLDLLVLKVQGHDIPAHASHPHQKDKRPKEESGEPEGEEGDLLSCAQEPKQRARRVIPSSEFRIIIGRADDIPLLTFARPSQAVKAVGR